ncbi:MAG: hypothetical protein PHU34_09340 [Candidatus Methanoperedens sp.]|nr:hypothetical protein [Candidatus Methanoperedens sp.]
MPFTPDLAAKLYEKITANIKLMEELKLKISEQIRESNRTGAQLSNSKVAQDTFLDIERISAQLETDYKRLEVESSWSPEVS